MYFCVKSSVGTQGKLDGCTPIPFHRPPVVYSTDHSNAIDPVLVLLCVACGLFYEAICFVLPCAILFLYFNPFSIAIASLR